jgi:hypothetical protein
MLLRSMVCMALKPLGFVCPTALHFILQKNMLRIFLITTT